MEIRRTPWVEYLQGHWQEDYVSPPPEKYSCKCALVLVLLRQTPPLVVSASTVMPMIESELFFCFLLPPWSLVSILCVLRISITTLATRLLRTYKLSREGEGEGEGERERNLILILIV